MGVDVTCGLLQVDSDAMSMVEAIFKVFNNMSQKFNQCFYFYLFVDGSVGATGFIAFSEYIG
jgi:hypothetical protein